MVLGPIPDAPGLEDLDTIHPVEEMIEIEKDEGPMPLPLPDIAPLALPINPLPVEGRTTAKKSSKAKRLLIVLVIFSGLGAAGWYAWSNGLI